VKRSFPSFPASSPHIGNKAFLKTVGVIDFSDAFAAAFAEQFF